MLVVIIVGVEGPEVEVVLVVVVDGHLDLLVAFVGFGLISVEQECLVFRTEPTIFCLLGLTIGLVVVMDLLHEGLVRGS